MYVFHNSSLTMEDSDNVIHFCVFGHLVDIFHLFRSRLYVDFLIVLCENEMIYDTHIRMDQQICITLNVIISGYLYLNRPVDEYK